MLNCKGSHPTKLFLLARCHAPKLLESSRKANVWHQEHCHFVGHFAAVHGTQSALCNGARAPDTVEMTPVGARLAASSAPKAGCQLATIALWEGACFDVLTFGFSTRRGHGQIRQPHPILIQLPNFFNVAIFLTLCRLCKLISGTEPKMMAPVPQMMAQTN